MPGPAPKPEEQRRRRNAPMANTVRLPAEGRSGEAPPWPLGGSTPPIWHELWATPQAVAWERLGWTRVVARYCLVARAAEAMDTQALPECRQLEDRLGLTPMSMLRLRWEVVADEVGSARQIAPSSTTRRLTLAGNDALEAG